MHEHVAINSAFFALARPLLKKVIDSGRMLSVTIETPANDMTEESHWDYRVTIRFKNSTLATTENPDEGKMIKQLWPAEEKYVREEQRRFEILLSHWDLSGHRYYTAVARIKRQC